MSANRIFLVCQHCPQPESALLLADRADGEAQYMGANLKRCDDWYGKHQRCGSGVDHFRLAYQRTQDWDVSPPAPATAVGVRIALANSTNGSTGGSHE
jgi:hypothetical protein